MRKIIFILLSLIVCISGYCCTTFTINHNGKIVFGRNFDFPIGDGYVIINKKGMVKSSFINAPEVPFEWVSKYGSISFNQNGKEFPFGGINEAGLVIEQMWLQDCEYPAMDNRFALTELQWIQYHLDNSASVKDVIKSDKFLRVSYTSIATLHFLVADKSGDVATIEYINGKMVVHRGQNLPYSVLANCRYTTSISYKASKDQNENFQFNPVVENSSGRFLKGAKMIEKIGKSMTMNSDELTSYAFTILDSVAQPGGTKWSIVYNITDMKIDIRTDKSRNISTLSLKMFNFDKNAPNLFADINQQISGADSFSELTYEENYKLIKHICDSVDFIRNSTPPNYAKVAADYMLSVKPK